MLPSDSFCDVPPEDEPGVESNSHNICVARSSSVTESDIGSCTSLDMQFLASADAMTQLRAVRNLTVRKVSVGFP